MISHRGCALLALCALVGACAGGSRSPASQPPAPSGAQAAPVSLFVPIAPTPVQVAGRTALVYELHVGDTGAAPLTIARVEALDADRPGRAPLLAYEGDAERASRKLLAPRGAAPTKSLAPGVREIVYLWAWLDSAAPTPRALLHRVTLADGRVATGARVPVAPPAALVLAPPVAEGDWWIGLGPSNGSDHRRAVIRVGEDTVPHLAQRFAIDWVQLDARGEYARDRAGKRNEDWYCYGRPVLAPADARVATVVDGIPDNEPGEDKRAVPMRVATVLGNYVVLDLGPAGADGTPAARLYGTFAHLRPGSRRVSEGDSVHRGDTLATIGNSGNSDGPHLHFHVTVAQQPELAALRAEGVPYLLDAFDVVRHDPELEAKHAPLTPLGRTQRALPAEGDVLRLTSRRRER